MEKKYKAVIVVLVITGILIGVLIAVYEMVDFYNDYKCSTTRDIDWFMDNNCMRYVEKEIRNK